MNIVYEGKANFKVPTGTILKSKDSKIKKIAIEADGERITLSLETQYESETEMVLATAKEVERITKGLQFSLGYSINELEWKKKVLGEESNTIYQAHSDMPSTLAVSAQYNAEAFQGFVDDLETRNQEADAFNLFVTIKNMKDKVGSFVMLYSLMSIYIGYQKEVDKYIKEKSPGIEERRTAKEGQNYHETIYTSLRNQVGHLSESMEADKVIEEIERHHNAFSDLVKNMLVEKAHI